MWDRLVSMFSLKRICTIRADFLRGRRVLSDERFLSQLGCAQTDIGRVSLLIRRVFGKICGVAPEMIFPSDDPMRLQSIMDWGQGYGWLFLNYRHWDPFEFDIEFWDEFKAGSYQHVSFAEDLSPFVASTWHHWKGDLPKTFGQWVIEAAEVILNVLPNRWEERLEVPIAFSERVSHEPNPTDDKD